MQCNKVVRRGRREILPVPGWNRSTTNEGDNMEAGTSAGGVVAVGLGLFILYVALSGLIVGALARWALPGPDPMSWPATIGFGIAGSFLGGLVSRLLHMPNLAGLLMSVAGAAFLIWFFRRRKASVAPPPSKPN
jgi:uncharacterized membrane protein YeaQ/YmgE (transglycosylase-associated protein family)